MNETEQQRNDRDVEYLTHILSGLITRDDELSISKTVDNMGVLLTVYVAKEDMGKIIGKQGTTAKAVRLLMKSYGFKNKADISVKINEPLSAY